MTKRLLSIAGLLATTAIFAAGCGGSDDSSEDAPTKAAYVTEADDICATNQEEISEIAKDLPDDINDPAVQDAISDEVLPIYQDQLTALRALTPPEGEENATTEIYDALEEALQKVEDDTSALNDPTTFEDANARAIDFGLEVCGS